MSDKITVVTTPKNRISINTPQSGSIKVISGAGGGGGGVGIRHFADLLDVDATNVQANNTVVYDAASGKYKVEELPVINGGEF